jgi:hypothetical protein
VLGLSQSYFGLAEGSVVAVSNLFLPLGIIGLRRRSLWAGICMLGLALENPYLAPLLPIWGGLMWLDQCICWSKSGSRPVAFLPLSRTLSAGVIGLLCVAILFGGAASPDYPTRLGEDFVSVLGLELEVVEQPWARVGLGEWFWPTEPSWTLDHTQGEVASGDGYLGLVLLALALVSIKWARSRAWPYLLLGGAGMVLGLGSTAGGVALPFAMLNGLMDLVARPLTQPSRFLALTGIGLGVAAGLALDAIRERAQRPLGVSLVALLALDGLFLGGLSMELPGTAVPQAECLESLSEESEAIVVVWPEDGSRYEGDLGRSWLLQLLHEQPAVHPGIASWRLHNGRSRDQLRGELGFTYMAPIGEAMGQPTGRPDVSAMREMGIDWVVADLERDASQAAWARAHFGEPDRVCDGFQVHRIGGDP